MFIENNQDFMEMTTDFIKPNLLSSAEGFIHGNLFKDEYKGYKNYQVKTPKAKTEKEAYLFKIMELEFAINDLNLYLDLHPEDKRTYEVMQNYVSELLQYESDYISKYGPLEVCDVISEDYKWLDGWPWEKEDSKYV